jgi:hypothetical protein
MINQEPNTMDAKFFMVTGLSTVLIGHLPPPTSHIKKIHQSVKPNLEERALSRETDNHGIGRIPIHARDWNDKKGQEKMKYEKI